MKTKLNCDKKVKVNHCIALCKKVPWPAIISNPTNLAEVTTILTDC